MLSFIPSGFNRVAAAATWKLHGGRDPPQNQPGDSGLDGLGRRRWTMAACCLTTVARCWAGCREVALNTLVMGKTFV